MFMPNRSQHQNKAKSNRAFLATVSSDHIPWAAVVAFCTAVHLIESLRASENDHSENHGDRNAYVQRSHREIHGAFRDLYNASRLARYHGNSEFHNAFPGSMVEDTVVGVWLVEVERYVEGRL